MFTIIISEKDIASMNIFNNLKKISPNLDFLITKEDIIYSDVKEAKGEYIIFASRHKSASENKTLTVHLIGNFGSAEFGGEDNLLSGVSSSLFKLFFQELNKQKEIANSDYEISLEATHHGPYVEKPTLFIEIGSTEKEWKDEKAGEIIAKTIINSINNFKEKNYKTAFALGGGHYCKAFNKIQLKEEYALTHICSKYNLQYITKDTIKDLLKKTKEKVEYVLLDWKGLSTQKERIIKLLEETNLKIIKV